MPRPINYEQLEAEQVAGMDYPVPFLHSQTSLVHLVMAAQLALRYPMNPGSAALFRDFIKEARRVGEFPPETAALLRQREQEIPHP